MEGSMVTSATQNIPAGLESRVLNEGYGPGAWHGADLKAALGDVGAALAFWRPAAGRHNIAEIALHHAYCAGGARADHRGRARAVRASGRRLVRSAGREGDDLGGGQ